MLKPYKKTFFLSLTLLIILFNINLAAQSQETPIEEEIDDFQEQALKVFIEIRENRLELIKKEIPFVNYVRDLEQAQVFILENTQRTGAGGSEYTFTFFGKKDFANINDTLIYISSQTETEIETVTGIINVLKRGLIKYIGKTPQMEFINISYGKKTQLPKKMSDDWNSWFFTSRVSTRLEGSSSKESFSVDGSFSADRVTEDLKLSFSASTFYNKDEYTYVDTSNIEQISTNIRKSYGLKSLLVASINNHWSLGAYASLNSSLYSNINLASEFAPAIEFNVFPYSVATRRELRFLYKVGLKDVSYSEETIYNKTAELLSYESLSASFELKEQWGSLMSTIEASHYFNDFRKNNLRFSCNVNVKLFEGFSMDVSGSYSQIRDQISLRKGTVSETELYKNNREILTSYNYRISVGFRYSFGSIFSNVVNPRFGGSSDGH